MITARLRVNRVSRTNVSRFRRVRYGRVKQTESNEGPGWFHAVSGRYCVRCTVHRIRCRVRGRSGPFEADRTRWVGPVLSSAFANRDNRSETDTCARTCICKSRTHCTWNLALSLGGRDKNKPRAKWTRPSVPHTFSIRIEIRPRNASSHHPSLHRPGAGVIAWRSIFHYYTKTVYYTGELIVLLLMLCSNR